MKNCASTFFACRAFAADNKGPVDLCSTEPTEPDFRRARHRTFESRIGLEKKSSDTIRYHCFFLERETGIEPATPSLARRCSTTEPLAHACIQTVRRKYYYIHDHIICQAIFIKFIQQIPPAAFQTHPVHPV